MTVIDLQKLLSCCVYAVREAGETIRRIYGEGDLQTILKDEDDTRSALTIADTSAQVLIVSILKSQFPDLHVIGEEDIEGHEICPEKKKKISDEENFEDLEIDVPQAFHGVENDDICVFIDPIDGTREFISGRIENCQTLIGISWKGKSIAGVMGLIFHMDEIKKQQKIIYGFVGSGVYGIHRKAYLATASSSPAETIFKILSSSSLSTATSIVTPATPYFSSRKKTTLTGSSDISKNEILENLNRIIGCDEYLPLGGCGSKCFQLLIGNADIAMQNFITCLWDSCATEALITATGGKCTDFYGNDLVHKRDSRVGNIYGVIATRKNIEDVLYTKKDHHGLMNDIKKSGILHPIMNKETETENEKILAFRSLIKNSGFRSGSADIARSVDGDLLTVAYLSKLIGKTVVSYSAPCESAVRYLQSMAVRLNLVIKEGDKTREESMFYKRIVLREIPHARHKLFTAPSKLTRDVQSYNVECSFLQSNAIDHLIKDAKIHFPQVYSVVRNPDFVNPIESKFSILMEDFSPNKGFKQFGILDKGNMSAALRTLAKFHGFFWEGSNYMRNLENKNELITCWDRASYWTVDQQPANQIDSLPEEWNKLCNRFGSEFPEFLTEPYQKIGQQLYKIAKVMDKKMDPATCPKWKTIVHGDTKSANFFFKQEGQGENIDVALIDFQWCGFAFVSIDLVYLILSSSSIDLLILEGDDEEKGLSLGEHELLGIYYRTLCDQLVKFDVVENLAAAEALFSFSDLCYQYEIAFMDFFRIIVAYHWGRIKASPDVLRSRATLMSCNAYNRSILHLQYVILRGKFLLDKHINDIYI